MPSKNTPFMGTTEISAERSAAEIVAELVKAGATSINTDYADGVIKGIRWIMRVANRGDVLFSMPARVDAVYRLMRRQRRAMTPTEERALQEKARRIAWRQLLRWVQAQMAMIQCGMAEAGEVFFPYIQGPTGETAYEMFRDHGLKLLNSGEPS